MAYNGLGIGEAAAPTSRRTQVSAVLPIPCYAPLLVVMAGQSRQSGKCQAIIPVISENNEVEQQQSQRVKQVEEMTEEELSIFLIENDYIKSYPVPEDIKEAVIQCEKIRRGDTGLSKEEAKGFIMKYFPRKVWTNLYPRQTFPKPNVLVAKEIYNTYLLD